MSSGKYALGDKLGGGGMAEVFRANVIGAEGFSRPVAIKRVLPEHSANQAFADMFISEAKITSRFLHPNVVNVLDFDRDEQGRLFLVMEMVEGVDVRRLLKSGPVPHSVLIHVVIETLRGLGYAHALASEHGKPLGIVHRDVSPDNVLISWDGAIKVSDFGIAKAYAATGATRSGILKGKIIYMSPEQANTERLDGRADLFSVGMMLYRALVGRMPFDETLGIAAYIGHLLTAPIVPPHEVSADVPADLSAVTMHLLEKDPARRCPNAAAAIDALMACGDFSPRAQAELVGLLAARFPDDAPARTAEHAVSHAAGSDAATYVPPSLPSKGSTKAAPVGALQSYPTPVMAGERSPTATRGGRGALIAVVGAVVALAAAVALVITFAGGPGGAGHDGAPDEIQEAAAPVEIDAGVASAVMAPPDAGVDAFVAPVDAGPPDARPKRSGTKRYTDKDKPPKRPPTKGAGDQPNWDLPIEKE